MSIDIYAPGEARLVIRRGAATPITVVIKPEGQPLDLTGCEVGITLTGLAGGETLRLTTATPPPATVDDRRSYITLLPDKPGGLEFKLSAADALRVRPGRHGRYRLWLAAEGGEHPIASGQIEGRDT